MIHANNKGACLFNRGDYHGAMDAFQCGVDVMFAWQLQQTPPCRSELDVGCCTPSKDLYNAVGFASTVERERSLSVVTGSCVPINAAVECATSKTPHVTMNVDPILFVYNRPLVLHQDDCTSSPLNLLVSSSVLLFNFGLACQHVGIVTGSEILSRRAMQLYSLTLSALHGSYTHNAALGLVQCLALNNLAHLHYENCDYATSQGCLECLAETERLSGWLSSSTASMILLESEYDEIIRNVAYNSPPPTAQAA